MPGMNICGGRPKIVPYCLSHNHTVAVSLVRRTTGPGPFPPLAMHVAFFDDRAVPGLNGMQLAMNSIYAIETSDAPIVVHLVFLHTPRGPTPRGAVVHVLRDGVGVDTEDSVVKLVHCLHRNMARSVRGPGRHYLYKPLLHLLLSPDIEQLIVLDTDTLLVRPLSELWVEFARFSPMSVIGVAPEQNSRYSPMAGTNGGVQLLHLRRMRESMLYTQLLDWHASGASNCSTGHFGDQTVYTIIGHTSPLLLHRLPCEWNRQLNPGEDQRIVSYACGGRCGLLHGTGNTKCVIRIMRKYNSSCAAWSRISRGETLPGERKCMPYARFTTTMPLHYADCCI